MLSVLLSFGLSITYVLGSASAQVDSPKGLPPKQTMPADIRHALILEGLTSSDAKTRLWCLEQLKTEELTHNDLKMVHTNFNRLSERGQPDPSLNVPLGTLSSFSVPRWKPHIGSFNTVAQRLFDRESPLTLVWIIDGLGSTDISVRNMAVALLDYLIVPILDDVTDEMRTSLGNDVRIDAASPPAFVPEGVPFLAVKRVDVKDSVCQVWTQWLLRTPDGKQKELVASLGHRLEPYQNMVHALRQLQEERLGGGNTSRPR